MGYAVRAATGGDLDVLAGYEAAAARRRFGSQARDEPERHRHKLARALRRDPAGMLVATGPDGSVAGWVWLAVNANALTGQRYVNCRSLAAEDPAALDLLVEHAVRYATEHGAREITGQVTPDETGVLAAYRRGGFTPEHLTMRLSR